MPRTYVIVAFLLLCSFKGLCQSLGFSLAEGRTKVEIPIEIRNNLIVIPVVLNGTLPLKFILDTGVRTSILTEKSFTDILNLTYSRKYVISAPGGEKLIEAYVTNNVSLELPGVLGPGHAMLVLEKDYLELRNYLGVDVHGILGYELFSRFIIEINYEKKLMTLMTPSRFRKKRKFHSVPIQVQDTKPYLTTTVVLADNTKISTKLLVDSGASHGLMLDPESDSLICVPDHVVSSVIGRGLGGEITGKVGRVKTLYMGPYKLDGAFANFPDPNSYFDSLKLGTSARHGSLGGETLSRFTVVFDFSKEKIYLKKNNAFRKGFHYNLSGLTIKAKGAKLNVFEITGVREQSVADQAGVQEGDELLTINGHSSKNVDLNFINALLNNKPGKRISMTLQRQGQRFKTDFRLRDEI